MLAAGVGLAALAGTATPARADAWIQFGLVAPTVAPPPIVVAPPPPAVYGYAYSYPYVYSYPYPYAVPSYGNSPFYAHRWDHWRHHYARDDNDRGDDD